MSPLDAYAIVCWIVGVLCIASVVVRVWEGKDKR